jgi:hypothetical protein
VAFLPSLSLGDIMATYASLNPVDRAIVDNTVNLLRGCAGELCKIFNKIKAIADDSNATGLVTSLDVGENVPNTSGLTGADDLSRTEAVNLYNFLNGIRTANDTAANRASMTKACGINAAVLL